MSDNQYAEHVERITHSLAAAAHDFLPFRQVDTPDPLFEMSRCALAKVLEAVALVAELEQTVDDYIRDQEHRGGV